jgi:hypothetical protein
MTDFEFDADHLIEASLPLLELDLDDVSRAGVKMHLETAERLWRTLRGFDLVDLTEPAPVYRV